MQLVCTPRSHRLYHITQPSITATASAAQTLPLAECSIIYA